MYSVSVLTVLAGLLAQIAAARNSSEPGLTAGYELDAELTGCSYSDTCVVNKLIGTDYEGVCVSVSGGCCSGTTTSGLCPGSSDIQCCPQNKCSTPYGSGTCMQTSACGGTSYSGYCTGPSDIQCCVTGGPAPAPSPTPASGKQLGIDVSSAISSSTLSCFSSNGYSDFIIPRGYRSTGSVDTGVCTTLNNAVTAGIKTRDVYMFPCPTCSKSASAQMSELVSYLNSNCKSAWSGRVWLDIEGSQYWLGSTSSNKAWYEELKDSCSTYGASCGVYSSSSQWSSIFGSSSYCYGSELPLWYAHYDNLQSFSDYTTFGCWTSPHAKQYAGDTTVCSTDVDKNYAEKF